MICRHREPRPGEEQSCPQVVGAGVGAGGWRRRARMPRLLCVLVAAVFSIKGAEGAASYREEARRHLAEAPTAGSCSTKMGGREITLSERAVQTSVDTVGSGVDGFTTYRIKLHLGPDAASVYTIFGTEDHRIIFPPAYHCAAPFGVDVGGVNPAFFEVASSDATGFAQYDSWLTVGITDGDTSNLLSSLGIDFRSWDEDHELLSDEGTGGAVFWMDPESAADVVVEGADRSVVIAQLTIAASPGGGASETARFDAREWLCLSRFVCPRVLAAFVPSLSLSACHSCGCS